MMDASIKNTGRYVGIELLPENCEIMRQNFAQNGFTNTAIVPEGVWFESGKLRVMGKGRQRNTLVDIDDGRLSDSTGYDAPVSPLSDILDRTLPRDSIVDFMYVSVNGAEYEALEGLGSWAHRVRALRVAALYSRNGQSTAKAVREKLKTLGFETDDLGNTIIGTRQC